MKLLKKLQKGRLIEKADSFEAQIMAVVMGLNNRVERGILPVKTITDVFNEDKSDRNKLTSQRMGRKLAAMGFEKAKTGDGASAIIWIDEIIQRVAAGYGLKQTSDISVTSETP